MSPTDPAHLLAPLMTPEAWDLLNSLEPYSPDTAWALNTRLRDQGWPPETVAAVLTQSKLRARAQSKFGDFSQHMLFTDAGLQQATRLPVAARHAQRFHRAGVTEVADLGCGIGADSLAFASSDLRVHAVDADEATAAAATINLRPFPEASVHHTTAEHFAEEFMQHDGGTRGVWLDPARRSERSRVWDPEEFSPPLSFVTELAATGIPLGVKLGPGIPHHLIPPQCEAEWVSMNGDLVEVVLWFNACARPGIRRAATVLRSSPEKPLETSSSELTSGTDFGEGIKLEPTGRDGLAQLICEPDPAVIRSGLVAEFCAELNGKLLDEHIAYFCCAQAPDAGLDTAALGSFFRIREVHDFQVRALKQWAAEQQLTRVDIKKRGVDVTPEELRQKILPKKARQNRSTPSSQATLILTRLGQERVAVVVDPL